MGREPREYFSLSLSVEKRKGIHRNEGIAAKFSGFLVGSGHVKPKVKSGGARRNRTDDLLHAMQALSQLSYDPTGLQGEPSSFGSGSGRNLGPRP